MSSDRPSAPDEASSDARDPDDQSPEEVRTSELLALERPRPSAPFRRELSSRVGAAAVRLRIRGRPARLWPVAVALALAGLGLLGVAAAGI